MSRVSRSLSAVAAALLLACSGSSHGPGMDEDGLQDGFTDGLRPRGGRETERRLALGEDAGAAPDASGGDDLSTQGAAGGAAPDPSMPVPVAGGQAPEPQAGGGGGAAEPSCDPNATPRVLLVIDGSGSMCAPFEGTTTRWQAVRSAVLDQGGALAGMQERALLGALVFDGTIDIGVAAMSTGGSPGAQCSSVYTTTKQTGECPGLLRAEPALDNMSALAAVLPEIEPGGSSPTHLALKAAVDMVIGDAADYPTHIVLFTDGLPTDICVGGTGGDSSAHQSAVLDEIDRAADAGIVTHAISLSPGDAALRTHMDLAAERGGSERAYAPATSDELQGALESVAEVAACAP